MAATNRMNISRTESELPDDGMQTEGRSCNRRFDALWRNIIEAVAIIDRDLTIVVANEALQDLFFPHPLTGEKCFKAFRGKPRPCLNCPAFRSMETGETVRGKRLQMGRCQDGQELHWTISPIASPSGQIEEVLLVVAPPDRQPHESFVARLAHKINNPLASITGFSEGLLKRLENPPAGLNGKMLDFFKEYLKIINTEAYRCKGILQKALREKHLPGD